MRLRDLAHGRTGDKGDVSDISVIARRPEDYEWLAARVTVERVRAHLAGVARGDVARYELPALGALNFVLRGRWAASPARSRSTPTARAWPPRRSTWNCRTWNCRMWNCRMWSCRT